MKNINIPDWLKSLQENSWELELFISGGAIFTLFQASDGLLAFSEALRISMVLPGHHIVLLIAMFGIKLLTLGFIFHLLLRAFWVAMVFINFVYPKGVNSKNIRWKKPFTVDLDERSDLFNPIMKVDRISGIVMYLSIISTFAIIGFIFMLVVFILISSIGIIPDAASVILNKILIYSVILYTFDLLSFGSLRSIPFLSYLVYPFFKIYDYLSLRFLFKRGLMVYSTNVKKLNAVITSLIFVIIAISSSYISVQKSLHWPNILDSREYRHQMARNESLSYYADENRDQKVTIQSKIIDDDFLDLKVDYWALDNVLMEGLDKPVNERYFSDVMSIKIDDSLYHDIKWFSYYSRGSRYGIEALIPISDLKMGEHILLLELKDELKESVEGSLELRQRVAIPFWKNSKNSN